MQERPVRCPQGQVRHRHHRPREAGPQVRFQEDRRRPGVRVGLCGRRGLLQGRVHRRPVPRPALLGRGHLRLQGCGRGRPAHAANRQGRPRRPAREVGKIVGVLPEGVGDHDPLLHVGDLRLPGQQPGRLQEGRLGQLLGQHDDPGPPAGQLDEPRDHGQRTPRPAPRTVDDPCPVQRQGQDPVQPRLGTAAFLS